MAKSRTRIEGGAVCCWYCNRTLTFNFIRDRDYQECTCDLARQERAAAGAIKGIRKEGHAS